MENLEAKPKLLAVVGPTASGKTDLAIRIAKRVKRAEIISADSRQFYRGTDIGTDIIDGEWVKVDGRRVYMAHGVPHHMIAFRPVSKPVTMGEFKRLVKRRIREISGRGNLPILCGGTGLYVHAVTDNYLVPDVEPDQAFRDRMSRKKTETLWKELLKKDPEYAGRIQKQNRRYITRGLEVIRATGRLMSEQQVKGEPEYDVLKLGIRREREDIYERVNKRVHLQIERGLIRETEKLAKRFGWDFPAMTGLGHKQIGMYLRGEVDLDEAVRLIQRDTRRYARRQLTWWRRDDSVIWVKGAEQAVKLTRDFLRKRG